jgi:hypothetical protein
MNVHGLRRRSTDLEPRLAVRARILHRMMATASLVEPRGLNHPNKIGAEPIKPPRGAADWICVIALPAEPGPLGRFGRSTVPGRVPALRNCQYCRRTGQTLNRLTA